MRVTLPARGGRALVAGALVPVCVAAALFWIAWDDGSYSVASRNTLAIVVWWAVALGIGVRAFGVSSLTRESLAAGALLAGLALLTLASVFWGPDAEAALEEFNRVSLYLAVLALVVLASSRATLGRWLDGLALGVAAVAIVALSSRLFPGLFSTRGLPAFLPSAATRLSFPLGYWNGLAIFLALGVPLLLRIALVARNAVVAALALTPLPIMAAAIYLTSSRGGVAAAAVATTVFLVLTEWRWRAAGALAAAGLGSAAAIGVLLTRAELVDGPLGTDLVEGQGRSAAALIALVALATGAAFWFGAWLLPGRVRLDRRIGWVVVALLVAAVVTGFAAADPGRRIDEFKARPGELPIDETDFVRAHLLSGTGNGRWQFWDSALDEWQANPTIGGGAGTFESWWARNGSFYYFIRDAHSLYLEMLGELGPLALLVVVGLLALGVVTGVRRALAATGELRVGCAALTAGLAAYAVAAGVDWMWELTAVTVLAVVMLGLLTGAATAPTDRLRLVTTPDARGRRLGFGAGVAAVVVAWLLICVQALPLLADLKIRDSKVAVARNDLGGAARAALDARDIEPWAASPYVQLALVDERAGALRRARAWIGEAIERDPDDWRYWLIATRLDAKLGDTAEARRSLRRAAELNPRSPLFAGLR
jgi:O-Antigen ligase